MTGVQAMTGGMDDPSQPLHRRVKQVEAREVAPESISRPPLAPAPPRQRCTDDLADALRTAPHEPAARRLAPTDAAPPVVDTTEFIQRHRKRSHERIYRITQFAVGISYAAGAVAMVLALSPEDVRLGSAFGAASLIAAGGAWALSRKTQLSRRLSGYAVGAIAFSLLSLAALFAANRWGRSHDDYYRAPYQGAADGNLVYTSSN